MRSIGLSLLAAWVCRTCLGADAAAPTDDVNVLIVTADQLRFDALRFVQDQTRAYDGHLKVRTPNLDRLAAESVVFTDAYSQSASCAPARATLRSGCTEERNGIQHNALLQEWMNYPDVTRKVNAVRTYDQILGSVGYESESYGKWHCPTRWFSSADGAAQVVQYDTYSFPMKKPMFTGSLITTARYVNQLRYWAERGQAPEKLYYEGDQMNPRSKWPYTPMPLDPRYGLDNVTSVAGVKENTVIGVDSLPSNCSMSAVTGSQGVLALQRLAQSRQPWALTISFENPHPPYVVSEEYASYYLDNQDDILVPPSIHGTIDNAFYAAQQAASIDQGFGDETLVQGWTAIYYGMVEQVDAWVGRILEELEYQNATENTLVVFTSDHGEFLGAHALHGKFGFFEEALRVPLIVRLPHGGGAGTHVRKPVSHLDLVSTILDYTGYSMLDESDGRSLRPRIEGTSYRKYGEDEYIVAEADVEGSHKVLGNFPNFMVRLGRYKLWMTKLASSESQDLLFDIATDPYEERNLLNARNMTLGQIGKAEHLKCLLLEWMQRHDGGGGGTEAYYSNPAYNWYKGNGDIAEIAARRTWPAVDQWLSHAAVLDFNAPVWDDGQWRSNAWLYLGRTTAGTLNVSDIAVEGDGRQYFSLSRTSGSIAQDDHLRVRVAFVSEAPVDASSIDVRVVIQSSAVPRQEVLVTMGQSYPDSAR